MTDSLKAKNRLPSIDILRALAVLAVFSVHVRGFWLQSLEPGAHGAGFVLDRLSAQGSAGVDLFVVLSGLCMTLPLVRNRESGVADIRVGRFYRRRAVRILPAYYAALALVVALELMPVIQRHLVLKPLTLPVVLAHVALVQPLFTSAEGAVNGPLWSISLEITLYLVFPLLLWWRRRWGWVSLQVMALTLLVVWSAATAALNGAAPSREVLPTPSHLLPAHLFEFTAGMFAAHLLTHPRPRQSLVGLLTFLAGAPIGALGTVADHDFLRIAGWGAAAAGLTVWFCSRSGKATSVGWQAAARLGVVSYSFYLLHQPFLLLTQTLARQVTRQPVPLYLLAATVALPAAAGLAYAFFQGVERPFLVAGGMRDAVVTDELTLVRSLPERP